VLLVDDVRNTGQTLVRCAELVRAAGGSVVATAQIYDRMEAVFDAGRAQRGAGRVQGAREPRGKLMPAVPRRRANHRVLTPASRPGLQERLDTVYRTFDHVDSALDPVHIVRRLRLARGPRGRRLLRRGAGLRPRRERDCSRWRRCCA
jgi:hypothetical protein